MSLQLSGLRVGRLLVLDRAGKIGTCWGWNVVCDCGSRRVVRGPCLKAGRTRSCGCLVADSIRRRSTTHGQARVGRVTRAYHAWLTMRERCRSHGAKHWRYYGSRGIRVCARWDDYASFVADMGERPSAGHSIDRINNEGNYEPGNCRLGNCKRTGSQPPP